MDRSEIKNHVDFKRSIFKILKAKDYIVEFDSHKMLIELSEIIPFNNETKRILEPIFEEVAGESYSNIPSFSRILENTLKKSSQIDNRISLSSKGQNIPSSISKLLLELKDEILSLYQKSRSLESLCESLKQKLKDQKLHYDEFKRHLCVTMESKPSAPKFITSSENSFDEILELPDSSTTFSNKNEEDAVVYS